MATAYIDPGSPLADYLDDDETVLPPSLDEVVTGLSGPDGQSPVLSSDSLTSAAPPPRPTSPTSVASPASHTSHSSTSATSAVSPSLSTSRTPPIHLISPTTPTTPTPISAVTTSRSTDTRSSLSVRPSPSRKLSDDGFAERFKYLICSSALLERDYVPGLGSDADDVTSEKSASPTATHFASSLQGDTDSGRTIWDQARLVMEPVWTDLQSTVGGRWDIILAGGVAVIAVGWILGWKRVMSIFVMAVCAVGFWVYISLDGVASTPSRPLIDANPPPSGVSSQPSTRSDALDTLTDLLSSSRKLDNSIEKSLTHLNPHPTDHQQLHSLRVALHRLTSAMTDNLATATSTLLGLVDKDELAVLGEMYDIPVAGSFLYPRKGRHPAITGEEEESDADDDAPAGRGARLGGSVPSPRRPRLSLSLQPADNHGQYAHPMIMSRSLPDAPGRHTHSPRSHHLSLSLSPRRFATPTSAASAPDDRFTSLPSRTPRISKRSSWDVDTWSTVRDQLSPSPSVNARRLSRPSHERRITEADENAAESPAEDAGEPESRDLQGSDNLVDREHPAPALYGLSASASASVPTSPSPFPRQTRTTRRSPLAGDPAVETLPSIGHLPSPFKSTSSTVATPNTKRRSLQNMPYNPPTYSPPDSAVLGADMAGAGLSRTRSLPFSDIQSLRSRYATGNRSRTSSITNANPNGSPSPSLVPSSPYAPEFAVALHSPTPRIRRVVSVSPLTLPSLKAACHAIHMRRRRLACCLLGLRFDRQSADYWDDVVGAMRNLGAQVDAERERLEEAIADAREQIIASTRDHNPDPAPWTHRQMDSLDSTVSWTNFAPRTSDEQMLKEQIEAIRATLDKAWKDLDRASRAVASARPDSGSGMGSLSVEKIDAEWSGVRRDLGEMVRSWERGREIIKRLTADAEKRAHSMAGEDHNGDAEHRRGLASQNEGEVEGQSAPAPNFLRAWSDDGDGSPSTSFETDRAPASLDGQVDDADADIATAELPLPGKDVVFEVDVPGFVRDRPASALSRDERIRLTKEARAKGLTLGEMLAASRGGSEEVEVYAKTQDRERERQGGMVLDELRGMMDLIKARKGGG